MQNLLDKNYVSYKVKAIESQVKDMFIRVYNVM